MNNIIALNEVLQYTGYAIVAIAILLVLLAIFIFVIVRIWRALFREFFDGSKNWDV